MLKLLVHPSARRRGIARALMVALEPIALSEERTLLTLDTWTGKAAERGGSKIPGVTNAPMGLYPCAPGGPNDYVYIMTSRANPDHWDRLLKLIGREGELG